MIHDTYPEILNPNLTCLRHLETFSDENENMAPSALELVNLSRANDACRMFARDGIIYLSHTEARTPNGDNAISAKYVLSLRVVYFTSMRVFYSGPVC